MKNLGMRGYGLLIVLGVAWLVGRQGEPRLSADQGGGLPALETRVVALEAAVASLQQTNTSQAAQITALTTRLLAVEAKTAPISVAGTSFTITGKNVFIQDGSGATDSATGLGNLTIGYNELVGGPSDDRSGTHNLILGVFNNYSSFGGLVAGFANEISNEYATVTGGAFNTASGNSASVSGGVQNRASGIGASVAGGNDNWAAGLYATISGGIHNRATGDYCSVSGGNSNVAGPGRWAAVSGGTQHAAPNEGNWAAGMLFQDH
jgi:hypothetical protein